MLRLTWRLFLAAGWAPVAVFVLHVVSSRVVNVYGAFPAWDLPMHVAGGVAIAHFAVRCLRAVPAPYLAPPVRGPLVAATGWALTATAALFWEFAEWFADRYLGTHSQGGLNDTLLDMALGVAGGSLYLLLASRRVAKPAPLPG